MDQHKVFLAIVGMTVVTYLPRVVPAWLLSNRELPDALRRWLRFVPVAVLSTLLLPSILLDAKSRAFDLHWSNLGLLVSAPTVALALLTRSFLGTVVFGVAVVAAIRYLMTTGAVA